MDLVLLVSGGKNLFLLGGLPGVMVVWVGLFIWFVFLGMLTYLILVVCLCSWLGLALLVSLPTRQERKENPLSCVFL